MLNSLLRKQSGLSLIELMISITVGLLLLAGLLLIFSNSVSTHNEIEKSGRQIENGGYAIQLITRDLKLSGYLGDLPTTPPAPVALPNPCSTDLAELADAMGVHIQGYDKNAGNLDCLSDVKANTDVLVVRHAATCSSANPQDSNCDPITTGYTYLQVSGCAADTVPARFLLDTNTANLTLHKIGCLNTARILRYRTHIYFIANNYTAGDGVPTLKRWELGRGIVALVDGVDQIQFEYGLDTNADGVPDSYTAAPASVADWANVMAVKLHVLARNKDLSVGHSDTKTYSLGVNADGSSNTLGPFNDAYKRHAYSTTVRLDNTAGRRE